MVWRVSFQHKRLQTRMENMRKFRRQHEQLRTVIVRVLRPTVRQVSGQGGEGDVAEQPKADVLAMDVADANAIEVSIYQYQNLCTMIVILS